MNPRGLKRCCVMTKMLGMKQSWKENREKLAKSRESIEHILFSSLTEGGEDGVLLSGKLRLQASLSTRSSGSALYFPSQMLKYVIKYWMYVGVKFHEHIETLILLVLNSLVSLLASLPPETAVRPLLFSSPPQIGCWPGPAHWKRGWRRGSLS